MAVISASAEAISWNEGSAFFWTGAATNSALVSYARGIRVTLAKETYHARPPLTGAETYIELNRHGTLAIDYLYADKNLLMFLYAGTGGQYHVHLAHTVPGAANISGGIYLYTGILNNADFAGGEGAPEQTISVAGDFEQWTAY